VLLTLLLLALPALLLVLFGHRAQEFLPKARDWMNTHSWVANEIVIACSSASPSTAFWASGDAPSRPWAGTSRSQSSRPVTPLIPR